MTDPAPYVIRYRRPDGTGGMLMIPTNTTLRLIREHVRFVLGPDTEIDWSELPKDSH